ncbi:hypothetical protein N7470_001439 [Penicillium chermesinum]|nr:hypothetical protein N7470_001439 [Penicillium chermesinum]
MDKFSSQISLCLRSQSLWVPAEETSPAGLADITAPIDDVRDRSEVLPESVAEENAIPIEPEVAPQADTSEEPSAEADQPIESSEPAKTVEEASDQPVVDASLETETIDSSKLSAKERKKLAKKAKKNGNKEIVPSTAEEEKSAEPEVVADAEPQATEAVEAAAKSQETAGVSEGPSSVHAEDTPGTEELMVPEGESEEVKGLKPEESKESQDIITPPVEEVIKELVPRPTEPVEPVESEREALKEANEEIQVLPAETPLVESKSQKKKRKKAEKEAAEMKAAEKALQEQQQEIQNISTDETLATEATATTVPGHAASTRDFETESAAKPSVLEEPVVTEEVAPPSTDEAQVPAVEFPSENVLGSVYQPIKPSDDSAVVSEEASVPAGTIRDQAVEASP